MLAAELGILRLLFLRLDGAPIAFQLSIEDQHVMKTAFDDRYRAYSPGVLLNRAAIQDCFEHPDIRRFDFHGEAEKARREWTDSTDTQMRAEMFSTGVPASVERAAIQTAWGARDAVRRRVAVEVGEKVDTSSPAATLRSLATFGVSVWRRPLRSGAVNSEPSEGLQAGSAEKPETVLTP